MDARTIHSDMKSYLVCAIFFSCIHTVSFILTFNIANILCLLLILCFQSKATSTKFFSCDSILECDYLIFEREWQYMMLPIFFGQKKSAQSTWLLLYKYFLGYITDHFINFSIEKECSCHWSCYVYAILQNYLRKKKPSLFVYVTNDQYFCLLQFISIGIIYAISVKLLLAYICIVFLIGLSALAFLYCFNNQDEWLSKKEDVDWNT